MSYVAHGPIVWCERWDDMGWFDQAASCLINYRGWPVHHAAECYAQVGLLYNMMFNRDDMIHSAVNFQGCGLPFDLKAQIAEEVWGGADACDADKNYTPMNEHKANFAWWSIVTDVLHDSLTVCNWVWPMTMSPCEDPRLPRRSGPRGQVLHRRHRRGDHHRGPLQGGREDHDLQRANTVRGMVGKDRGHGLQRHAQHPRRRLRVDLHEGSRQGRLHRGVPTRWTRTTSRPR